MDPEITETPEDIEFASAFAELSAPATEPAAVAAEPEAEPAAEPVVAEPAAEPAAEPEAEPAAEPATDWERRAAELQAQLDAVQKPAAPTPAPVAEAPKPEPTPAYTPEEAKTLEAYYQDWPEIANAEALVRRTEYQKLAEFIFKTIDERYSPMATGYEAQAADSHYSAVVAAHPDYDSVVDKVQDWIAQQPPVLRGSLEQVAREGTTEDVIQMLSLYKKVNGVADPAPAAPAATAPVVVAPATKGAPPVSAAAKAAAAKLAPVASSRSVPNAPAAADDFDAAFAEATASLA